MDLFKIITYQLYLLQLENYELFRFWQLLFKKGLFPKKNQSKDLVWTKKAKALMQMAVGLHLLIFVSLYFATHSWLLPIIIFLILSLGYFLLFSIALILVWPLDFTAKRIIIGKAKSKIRYQPNLKIIGIAGSYGKTTMKNVLQTVLGQKFKAISTPESVNTPVGIARWILKEVNASTEVIIVEMGEHYLGDIQYLCSITPPDIAVVTGINQAHLERMKSMGNIVATVFEIVSGTKPQGLIVLNGDDKLVMENYKKFVWPDHKILEYKEAGIKNRNFDQEKLSWQADFDQLGKIKLNLLGEYGLGDTVAAVIVAKSLGMNADQIKA